MTKYTIGSLQSEQVFKDCLDTTKSIKKALGRYSDVKFYTKSVVFSRKPPKDHMYAVYKVTYKYKGRELILWDGHLESIERAVKIQKKLLPVLKRMVIKSVN
jgi:hypothetical protein